MGKGSKRRPLSVDVETFEERWQRTFGPTVRGMEPRDESESDGGDEKQEEEQ